MVACTLASPDTAGLIATIARITPPTVASATGAPSLSWVEPTTPTRPRTRSRKNTTTSSSLPKGLPVFRSRPLRPPAVTTHLSRLLYLQPGQEVQEAREGPQARAAHHRRLLH